MNSYSSFLPPSSLLKSFPWKLSLFSVSKTLPSHDCIITLQKTAFPLALWPLPFFFFSFQPLYVKYLLNAVFGIFLSSICMCSSCYLIAPDNFSYHLNCYELLNACLHPRPPFCGLKPGVYSFKGHFQRCFLQPFSSHMNRSVSLKLLTHFFPQISVFGGSIQEASHTTRWDLHKKVVVRLFAISAL